MNGQHIKDTLKNNGVKVAQVATTLGMTRQRMNSLLNCDDIKVGTLEKIASASGLPLSKFFGYDTDSETAKKLDEINAKIDLLLQK